MAGGLDETDAGNPVPLLRRHLAAVVAGNALEFYDFVTYSFFAVYIGAAFFPRADANASLLLSLAVFGAGFVTRPIGGLVIGALGDRLGRRPAMVLSFSLMGVAILGLVLTPSYAAIGIAAPVLVLVFRLLQGFALGGDVGPTTAFLVEAAPPPRRGLYGALQSTTQYAAVLVAGLIGSGLAAMLDPPALQAWGWRLALGAGALIIPFGLVMRRSLPETMMAPGVHHSASGLLRAHWHVVLFGLVMLAGGTISTYVILYIPTYAVATLGMSPQWSFAATLTIGVCGVICAPLGGLLSDRFGRKPVMMASSVGLLTAAVPGFVLLSIWRDGPTLLFVAGTLSVLLAAGIAVIIVAVTESFPPRIRAGATATLYALAIAIFGGSAQFGVAWATRVTGDVIAPAYYMSAAVLAGLAAIIAMKESAPVIRAGR